MGAEQSTLSESSEYFSKLKESKKIKFHLQDVEHSVSMENVDPNTSLNSYLRDTLHMTGTKAMCYEGGCGACVVVLRTKNPNTQKNVFLAVNSCLVPLLSCEGWQIYTVEGIGNPIDGYHPIQKILAKFNGTQCGFCSPGMVMNMYALYKSENLTMEKIENAFGGNLCRCTGYRSILSAFKSLSEDADPVLLGECPDIEELAMCRKEKCERKCSEKCESEAIKEPCFIEFADSRWVKVFTLRDLRQTLQTITSTYRLVAGNTAQGVYKSYQKDVDVYIDILDVAELKKYEADDKSVILGANVTLTDTINLFYQTASNYSGFAYLKLLAQHIELVANVPVRNRGTIAGNLMIKHDHHEFPSDIFLILETVGAKLTIVDTNGQETQLNPRDFVNHDMTLKILTTITLKPISDVQKYVSFKIMPRAQNVHAWVNSGYLFKFDGNNTIEDATIIYGNINPDFIHAQQTEKFLIGKNLFDNSVLSQAYKLLDSELNPKPAPPDPSPEFRKQLAIALFYKAVLSIAPADKISAKNKSGGSLLQRPISSGVQDYETNKSMYPLTKAIAKSEALAQTSGQAQFVVDMPDLPYQQYGALVLAKAPPNSTITKIDATRALKHKDVTAFFSKDDIPGENTFTPVMPFINSNEEVFCSKTIKYYDQPIGILIGNNEQAVTEAIKLVDVTYDPPPQNEKPLLTIRQILKSGRNDRINEYKTTTATRKGNDVKHVIKGTFDIYHQYHFHMETHCCNIVPNEDGLDVYSSTQWLDLVQFGIAKVLNIPKSKITVTVRRCGGSFGAKISRAGLVACAAALAAWKLRKPVKLRLPLATNMRAIGKRFPFSTNYEVGVNDKGQIQYLECYMYTDVGYQFNEDVTDWLSKIFLTIYTSDTFTVHFNRAVTDTHVNTWTRAPGSNEGLAALEEIIEHIAYVTKLDPLNVRLANLSNETPIAKYITDIKSWANLDQRQADIIQFNKQNRWKKKGLAVVPMSFDMFVFGPFLATVSIFHGDGSVQICHGGVEIGQGINTKAAQVCAYLFNIPLEKITVIPSTSFVTVNTTLTGGSITSDAICYGVLQACNILLERIKPYRSDGMEWEDVIKKSYENSVKLKASGMYSAKDPNLENYSVYGICATEVEVDILTGQYLITRVDLIQDTGVTLNPLIDVGQVEGAFVMGMGYNTSEKVVFDSNGEIITNDTWTYHVPGAKDIPIDFRVKFPKNNPNPSGVFKSKGTGEPAISMSVSIAFSIRNAISSARKDASESNSLWYPIDGPSTIEKVFLRSLNNYSQYKL